MKRGHSNVYANQTTTWKDGPVGVAQVHTCKTLPPLALHKDDWEEIGRIMGWLPKPKESKRGKDKVVAHE